MLSNLKSLIQNKLLLVELELNCSESESSESETYSANDEVGESELSMMLGILSFK